MEVKLYTNDTCDRILNYRIDPGIRKMYDGDNFAIDNPTYLSQSIALAISEHDCQLGVTPADDVESSMKIFSALKTLDATQANDRRLWVTLTHDKFFLYTKQRWGITQSSSDNVIRDRFHFEGFGLRARNQNTIARLWWGARITYDETRNDPFELTKLLWEKQDFYQNLIDRKFSTYPGVLHGFLNFYKLNRSIDQKFQMRKLFKGLNAFGGVKILSLLDSKAVQGVLEQLCRFYKISFKTE